MKKYTLLDKIESPEDIKKLSNKELSELCDEIRDFLLEKVSKTGGHLASNIGAVELSVGLHYVFSCPEDHIMFDVGHQSYVHKILTGRRGRFDSLRKLNGLSGFMKPEESEYDCFVSGHASNSISIALGMARADMLQGKKNSSVCLIGDGALTGGLAYEALNDAACSDLPIVIVLNDNDMSISKNVGGMARWLSRIRLRPGYFNLKETMTAFLKKLGKPGVGIINFLSSIKKSIKHKILPANIFSVLGFYYLGPADGNNIESVINLLTQAKKLKKPVVVHFKTIKGKGYLYSEEAPEEYHSVSAFNASVGKGFDNGESFSSVFGSHLTKIAKTNSKVCAVTAAMELGTGLFDFHKEFPNRFFDVGIAEEHAVSMSAALSKGGLIPVCAVYSTFLQRAYDQLIHDVSLAGTNVIFGVDRSGPVGSDGPTHHGVFDVSYLRSIPAMKIFAPSSYSELRTALDMAVLNKNGSVAIKYPRGKEGEYTSDSFDKTVLCVKRGNDITLITYGVLINELIAASRLLNNLGIDAEIIKLNRLDNFDYNLIEESVSKTKRVIICEDSIEHGSMGESIASYLFKSHISANVKLINFKDGFVEAGTVQEIYRLYGLDSDSIAKTAALLIHSC